MSLRRFGLLIGVLLLISLALQGCGPKNTAKQGSNIRFTTPTQKMSPPPKELDRVESAAEDMVDSGVANNWRDVTSRIDTIDRNWPKLRSLLQAKGVSAASLQGFDTTLAALKGQAGKKNGRGVAIEANNLTSYVPDFLAKYKTTVPPSVSTIDYLGRRIKFEAEDGRWPAARKTLSEIMASWSAVKPQVLNRGGRTVAAKMDSTLSTLNSDVLATNKSGVIKNASKLLDEVDLVENAFTKR